MGLAVICYARLGSARGVQVCRCRLIGALDELFDGKPIGKVGCNARLQPARLLQPAGGFCNCVAHVQAAHVLLALHNCFVLWRLHDVMLVRTAASCG